MKTETKSGPGRQYRDWRVTRNIAGEEPKEASALACGRPRVDGSYSKPIDADDVTREVPRHTEPTRRCVDLHGAVVRGDAEASVAVVRLLVGVTRADAPDDVSDACVSVRFEGVGVGEYLRRKVVWFRHEHTQCDLRNLPLRRFLVIAAPQFSSYFHADVIALANAAREVRYFRNDDVIASREFELVRMLACERGGHHIVTRGVGEGIEVDGEDVRPSRRVVEEPHLHGLVE